MKHTTKTLAEAIQEMAQHVININRDPFAVIDCQLHIQVSSDHTEIYVRKGELDFLVMMTGCMTGIHDCKDVYHGMQNPYWFDSLKVADVIADIWAVSYNIDKMMSHNYMAVTA